MTSRILGVVREQVLAYLFGASNAMDAFNVAYRVPNLLRDLFAEGAMSAAFVPNFARELATKGKPSAFRLGVHVVTALLVITGSCGCLPAATVKCPASSSSRSCSPGSCCPS